MTSQFARQMGPVVSATLLACAALSACGGSTPVTQEAPSTTAAASAASSSRAPSPSISASAVGTLDGKSVTAQVKDQQGFEAAVKVTSGPFSGRDKLPSNCAAYFKPDAVVGGAFIRFEAKFPEKNGFKWPAGQKLSAAILGLSGDDPVACTEGFKINGATPVFSLTPEAPTRTYFIMTGVLPSPNNPSPSPVVPVGKFTVSLGDRYANTCGVGDDFKASDGVASDACSRQLSE